MFGWRRVGLTPAQAPGSLKAALPVLVLYCAFFVMIALAFPSGTASADDVAFQLTMPGLEEETFYRGILLFALYRAFTGRVRFLGVEDRKSVGEGKVVSVRVVRGGGRVIKNKRKT